MVNVDMEENTCKSVVKNHKKLTLAYWMSSWDRYTPIAATLDQLSFSQCVLHKAKIVELATEAVEGDRGPLVAVVYDELLRCVLDAAPDVSVSFRIACVGRNGKSLLARVFNSTSTSW